MRFEGESLCGGDIIGNNIKLKAAKHKINLNNAFTSSIKW